MKNKIFFAALAFVGNLICSEEYMKIPGPRLYNPNSQMNEMKYERQVRLEIAQIRAAEAAVQASEASAQLSRIVAQNETAKSKKEAAVQAEKQATKRISQECLNPVPLIIRWLLAGPKDCKVTSQIAPYTKAVTLEARATIKELGLTEDMAAYCCTDTQFTPINGERLYSKLYSAPLAELYTQNPEAFKRASTFEGLSFLAPSDISYWVLDYSGDLQPKAREKFLNIIHALRPGIIERKGQSLVMSYEDEEA